jgi:hypothetical protein
MNWEYKIALTSFGDLDIASAEMNSNGREGWELVSIVLNATGKDESWPVAVYKRSSAASDKSN